MTKLYAQEKRVFDINKITVVGSPTITSDGVASGFSSNNYLTVPFTPSNNTWQIEYKFKLSSIASASDLFGGNSASSPSLALTVVNARLTLSIGNGSAWQQSNIAGPTNLSANTDYYLKIEYTGSKYNLYLSTDGKNWILEITYTSSTATGSSTLNLGVSRSGTGQLLGSINLPSFKIYVDGQLVFQPVKPTYLLERRKEGFDISKFTVVGSPTITEDGVASGFSSSSYFQLKNIGSQLQNTTNWSIKFPIIFAEGTTTTRQEIFGGVSVTSPFPLIVRLWTSGYILVPVNGVSNTDNFTLQSKQTVIANTLYNLEIKVQDNVIYFYIDEELQAQRSITEKVKFDDILRLGVSINTTYFFKGSIDLSQFSITVDGKEVFTGAKEKFYAMRGM